MAVGEDDGEVGGVVLCRREVWGVIVVEAQVSERRRGGEWVYVEWWGLVLSAVEMCWATMARAALSRAASISVGE